MPHPSIANPVCQTRYNSGILSTNPVPILDPCRATNAKKTKKTIVGELRANILTGANVRNLVKLLDKEMDGAAREHSQKLEQMSGFLKTSELTLKSPSMAEFANRYVMEWSWGDSNPLPLQCH